MLLLLLRLLTVPAPVLPASTVAESAATPPAEVAPADPAARAESRANMATIEAGPRRIRALLPAARDRAIYASCVAQRLDEAQVHVAMAREAMQKLTAPQSSPAERARARDQLAMLAQRTREVHHAAVSCIDQDDSSISATRKETLVPPGLQKRPDPTRPPPPPYPCNGSGDCMVIPEP